MTILILGLIIFLGIHMLPVAVDLRATLHRRFGEYGYKGLFAAVSLVGFVLIVWGYGLARQDPVVIWDPPFWTRHLAALLVLFSFILVAAAYIPGKIKEKLHHPMIAGVKLWAFAHLLANGTLADIVLFGSFLAWGVVARISMKRRERAGVLTVTGGPVRNDVIAVVVGVAVYLAFVFDLHLRLIGVSPFGV